MSQKFGSKILNSEGKIVELAGKVKLGDQVIWNGRNNESCPDDKRFKIGEQYPVCFIHQTNSGVELSIDRGTEQVTIRAHDDEYSTVQ